MNEKSHQCIRKFGLILAVVLALTAFGAFTSSVRAGSVAIESATGGRYIIVFNDAVVDPARQAASLARQHGFRVQRLYSTALKGFSAHLSDAAVNALSRHPRIAYIEADQLAFATAQTVPTGVRRIFANDNENIMINGSDDYRIDVDVAVIDTGVFAHPDINLVGTADCTGNPFNETCTDGEGNDGNGHGTHVAGTIGALDNGFGVVGVAPGARIWAVKVLKDNGSGWISNIIGGIDWVTRHGDIEVANMSLGGGNSDALCQAVVASVDAGVTYAVAAGNDDADAAGSSPANCGEGNDGIITVSALADFDGEPGGLADSTCRTDQDDTLADFSNWGTAVDIAAPGVCINSTWNDGGYNTISGTSMAAPHVAGAAALLASTGMGPAAVHDALTSAGNSTWIDDSGDGTTEPLLDVSDTSQFEPKTGAGGGGDPVNTAPVVTIASPADGSAYASGASIAFSGSAIDAEDDDAALTGALAWTSDLDGPIGTGEMFDAPLSDGIHTITASVDDSAGASGTASVTITVGDATPPAGDMYVGGIQMQMKGPNLDTIVTIRSTPNEDPVSGVVPQVKLCSSSGSCYFETTQVVTDSNGEVKYKLLKPTTGTYIMTVLDVLPNGTSFAYNSDLNVTSSESYDVP